MDVNPRKQEGPDPMAEGDLDEPEDEELAEGEREREEDVEFGT